MRIAQFIDTKNLGGAENLLISLSKQIKESGNECFVIHFGNAWIENRCRQLGIASFKIPLYRYYKSIMTLPIFVLYLAYLLRKEKIDVLHTHLIDPLVASFLSCLVSQTRHVATLHDIYSLRDKKLYLFCIHLASCMGTNIVAVSNDICRYMSKIIRSGIFQKRVQVIYNGVSISDFNLPKSCSLSDRYEHGFSDQDFIFICVGRLVELKNHKTLIKAFARISENPKYKMVIVGEGPLQEAIFRSIQYYKLEDKIYLYGQRNDIPRLMSMSDCFVICSRTEGLNISIIEAMAAGLPVIVSDVGGNGEIVEDGVNGFLLPYFDDAAFAYKMQRIGENAELEKKMGYNALLRASRMFSITAMYEKYSFLYMID